MACCVQTEQTAKEFKKEKQNGIAQSFEPKGKKNPPKGKETSSSR